MSVYLLSKNYNTNYCEFSYDNWVNDGDKLPNLTTRGKDVLNTVGSCCQGSIAKGTDGTTHILTGNNQWVEYNGGFSGGSGGSSDSGGSSGGFIEL